MVLLSGRLQAVPAMRRHTKRIAPFASTPQTSLGKHSSTPARLRGTTDGHGFTLIRGAYRLPWASSSWPASCDDKDGSRQGSLGISQSVCISVHLWFLQLPLPISGFRFSLLHPFPQWFLQLSGPTSGFRFSPFQVFPPFPPFRFSPRFTPRTSLHSNAAKHTVIHRCGGSDRRDGAFNRSATCT